MYGKTTIYQTVANSKKILCLLLQEYLRLMIIMPGGAFRRAVITGVTNEPEWADLKQKLVFLRYAECEATQKRVFVVYAYAEGCGQREDAWKRLFAGAETVESIPDFDDCERYCRLKRAGLLKTLGTPIRKDAKRERNETREATSKKRKVCEECQCLTSRIRRRTDQIRRLQGENEELRKRLSKWEAVDSEDTSESGDAGAHAGRANERAPAVPAAPARTFPHREAYQRASEMMAASTRMRQ
jgi:hypothetical protein